MLQAVRGIYRGGIVELLETPEIAEDVEVVVTFLGGVGSSALVDASEASNVQPLEDFEPMVPVKPIRLSDLVLEGRE